MTTGLDGVIGRQLFDSVANFFFDILFRNRFVGWQKFRNRIGFCKRRTFALQGLVKDTGIHTVSKNGPCLHLFSQYLAMFVRKVLLGKDVIPFMNPRIPRGKVSIHKNKLVRALGLQLVHEHFDLLMQEVQLENIDFGVCLQTCKDSGHKLETQSLKLKDVTKGECMTNDTGYNFGIFLIKLLEVLEGSHALRGRPQKGFFGIQ